MTTWADYLEFVQETTPIKSVNERDGDENLKLLFDYSKEVFNEERNIFRDLENKASKYLTVFTALLAAAGFFANWLGIKVLYPQDWIETLLLVNGLALILAIFVTWLVIFLVLQIGSFEELPLDQATINFFLNKPTQQVYKDVSAGLKDAMEKNAETRTAKAKRLKYGHGLIIITWVLLLMFTALFVIYKGRTGEVEQKCYSAWLELTVVEDHHSIRLDISEKGGYFSWELLSDKQTSR